MRLIDGDELLKPVGSYERVKYTYEYGDVVTVEDIELMPTIDAEPREIGHWLPYEFGDYHWHKCSVCGKADKYIETIGNGDLQAIRHFCPICGARMDEDEISNIAKESAGKIAKALEKIRAKGMQKQNIKEDGEP